MTAHTHNLDETNECVTRIIDYLVSNGSMSEYHYSTLALAELLGEYEWMLGVGGKAIFSKSVE